MRTAPFAGIVLSMNTHESFKSSLVANVPMLVLLVLFAACMAAAVFTAYDPAAVDGNEPQNEVTFEKYRSQAEKVCGGPVVEASPAVDSDTVVVVKNDGSVAEVTVDHARDLMRADIPVWAVAVCVA